MLRNLGRRSRAYLSALTVSLGLALAGCAGGLGSLVSAAPPATYDLSAVQSFSHHPRRPRGQLIIAEPMALAALGGDNIVVRPAPGETAALVDAQWEDHLPKLVQARILQSFENAHWLKRVGRPAENLATDYVLVSELRAFQISVAGHSAVVEIAAKIVRQRTGRIMAAHVFRAEVPAPAMTGPGAVAALNAAFVTVAKRIVLWAAKVV